MAQTQTWQVGQNLKTYISRPRPIAGVGGDNATNFFLYFPGMPPGMQWVFPFVYGFLYPLPVAQVMPVLVDSSQFPAGANAPAAGSAQLALLTAWGLSDLPLAFSPGTPSTAQNLVRWNVNNAAGAGVQATIARAATPGATHTGDSFQGSMWNTGAATGPTTTFQILDGAGVIFAITLTLPATTGSSALFGPFGPGMNLRGTVGNSMTFRFSAGSAGVGQSVNGNGFDQ